MNRQHHLTFIAISFISCILLACNFGGGAGNKHQPVVPDPKPVLAEAKTTPDEEPIEIELLKFTPKPPPVFVLTKKETPFRQFTPVLSSTGSSLVDKIKVELVSAQTEHLRETDRQLIIQIRIQSDGHVPLDYKPWHSTVGKGISLPTARDEHGKTFVFQKPHAGAITGASAKLERGQPISDVIAFMVPPIASQEIDITLPGSNVALPFHQFKFKIGRAFFAKAEDEHIAKLDEDRQRMEFAQRLAEFKASEEVEAKRIEEANKKLIAEADAKAEQRRLASLEAEKIAQGQAQTWPNANNRPSGAFVSGKTVHVKGYYTKKGTYVAPHTRSAPRR